MERRFLEFPGTHPFVGWRHHAPVPTRAVAVVCGPIGSEYTRAHRTVRHLADRLAAAGIPAIRFDYHGQGDSPGDDLDPGRLAAWRENIRTAIHVARGGDSSLPVVLVGVRVGATLAAQVAADTPVDTLVVWNPVAKGRAYAREIQAMAAAAAVAQCAVPGAVESGGFVFSEETLADLRAVDLAATTPRVRRVIWLARDDLSLDPAVAIEWRSRGVEVRQEAVPGWSGMMAEHQFTVVPEAALTELVASLDLPEGDSSLPPIASAPRGEAVAGARLVAFDGLVAMLHLPPGKISRATVVMFNAGAVHRVGPSRIYVEMARRLAAEGHPVLRLDLEGLGDSILAGEGRENHPYPPTATRDARAALAYLKREHGLDRFVLLGLCSGAHTAFRAALEIEDARIEQVVMINPLTFRWEEGMGLETANRIYDELAYRLSARDPKRWLKLIKGEVNFRRLFAVAASLPLKALRSHWVAFCEAVLPALAPPLARDLQRLRRLGRPVAFFVADGDPGERLLNQGAPRTARRQLARGVITMMRIGNADHTFSQLAPRRALIGAVAKALVQPTVPRGAPALDLRRTSPAR